VDVQVRVSEEEEMIPVFELEGCRWVKKDEVIEFHEMNDSFWESLPKLVDEEGACGNIAHNGESY
jgi:hypothetical protein